MWSLYQQSKEWGILPSRILQVDPDCQYLCWCVDEAVLYFGRWVDGMLGMKHKTGVAKGKPVHSLAEVLDPNFGKVRKNQSLLGLMAMGGSFVGPAHL